MLGGGRGGGEEGADFVLHATTVSVEVFCSKTVGSQ